LEYGIHEVRISPIVKIMKATNVAPKNTKPIGAKTNPRKSILMKQNLT
jgi:hypothetical protein